jgi:hypothetical protein
MTRSACRFLVQCNASACSLVCEGCVNHATTAAAAALQATLCWLAVASTLRCGPVRCCLHQRSSSQAPGLTAHQATPATTQQVRQQLDHDDYIKCLHKCSCSITCCVHGASSCDAATWNCGVDQCMCHARLAGYVWLAGLVPQFCPEHC